MADEIPLHKPWLIAVWPGMGHVAISAGYYLMAKLGMYLQTELAAQDLFDIESVDVKDGLIQMSRQPRNRFFAWKNPKGEHDIIVFIGEAQPPQGKYKFCRWLVEYARNLGVERVFTFAAMATQMHPSDVSRVFGVASDEQNLEELKQGGIEILDNGQIGGLNGLLLGVAAESGLNGACLLGEMPHIFTQLPFPKASLAVLEVFAKMSGIEIDMAELSAQSVHMEQSLGQLLAQVEQQMQQNTPGEPEENEESFESEPAEEDQDGPDETDRIEELFEQAKKDRSAAYELKRELDRLEVYHKYEDRFLDLFRKTE